MKYSESNKPLVCMMTNSTCYKGTTQFTPKGVLWHSTGANNPLLKRYVQPSENDPNYAELMQLLGKNQYGNDWNHITHQAGLNAWIGKLADGTITTVQTMPWNYKPWGCGTAYKGGPSCNSTHLQFEICEDGLNDKNYFDKVYTEACEFTAYICKMYNIDPKGTISHAGKTVPTILCHQDSYQLGLGCNHGDVYHWFKKHGKTMDDVRNDVAKLMDSAPAQKPVTPALTNADFNVGDEVKLASGATYINGKSVPKWVIDSKLYVREIRGNDIVFSTLKSGAITGVANKKYFTKKNFELAVGDKVKIASGAEYINGKKIPFWLPAMPLYVRELRGDNVVISTLKTGAITGVVAKKYLTKV